MDSKSEQVKFMLRRHLVALSAAQSKRNRVDDRLFALRRQKPTKFTLRRIPMIERELMDAEAAEQAAFDTVHFFCAENRALASAISGWIAEFEAELLEISQPWHHSGDFIPHFVL